MYNNTAKNNDHSPLLLDCLTLKMEALCSS